MGILARIRSGFAALFGGMCPKMLAGEAALQGESLPVAKAPAPIPKSPASEIANMIFCGTSAMYGRARVVVAATGMHLPIQRSPGRIAQQ